jgi:hypothetical protein
MILEKRMKSKVAKWKPLRIKGLIKWRHLRHLFLVAVVFSIIYIKSHCMNIGRCRRGTPDFIMADSCVAGAQAPGRRWVCASDESITEKPNRNRIFLKTETEPHAIFVIPKIPKKIEIPRKKPNYDTIFSHQEICNSD